MRVDNSALTGVPFAVGNALRTGCAAGGAVSRTAAEGASMVRVKGCSSRKPS